MRRSFLLSMSVLSGGGLLADEWRLEGEKGPKWGVKETREVSGLAVSLTDSRWQWVLADSGNPAELYLMDVGGKLRGKVRLKGERNVDWEDLAIYREKGGAVKLVVADVGDNGAVREEVRLLVVAEPKLPGGEAFLDVEVPVEREIVFSYEGGPRDLESVAVDGKKREVWMISKRERPSGVYRLSLDAEKGAVAKRVADVVFPVPKGKGWKPYGWQPTGMAMSNDGRSVAVISYTGVYLFERRGEEDWAEAFRRGAKRVGVHGLPQAEAIAWESGDGALRVLSEGSAPMLRLVKP